MARIEIDSDSGFCFGVTTAISKAEQQLAAGGTLYCLGDIVHNSDEVERLRQKGLQTITHEDLATLPAGARVLLRAHGEPPSTYATAGRQGIDIVDATCPVVLKLQQRVKAAYDRDPDHRPQIVIYGKLGHAEVNGLVGQTDGQAIVVEKESDLDRLDYSRDIALFSQTTKSLEGYRAIIEEIKRRISPDARFEHYDTICRSVSGRVERLRKFAASHGLVLFVAGTKSSNGRILYDQCLAVNPSTRLIANASHLDPAWLEGAESVGICGATSTPLWLMEEVRDAVARYLSADD